MTNSQGKYIRQLNNFRWNRDSCEEIIKENSAFFGALNSLEQKILNSRSQCNADVSQEGIDDVQFLKWTLSMIYKFIYDNAVETCAPLYTIITQKSLETVFARSCIFTILCTFLHTSARIKGESFPDFICEYDPDRNFYLNNYGQYSKADLKAEAERLRKSRYRKLRQGSVYVPEYKWAAVPADLEHELSFRFVIDQCDSDLVDTYKRFGNLYNDILKTIDDEKSGDYAKNLLKAEEKFLAKVRKIDYSKYLRLQQQIIAHLKSDGKYIGINLYRLERTMMPWRIINCVNYLLYVKYDQKEERVFLQKTAYLKEIPFPKIYDTLLFLPEKAEKIGMYAALFDRFIYEAGIVGCLLLDALIEDGFLGDNWADTMRCTMNILSKVILYVPRKQDFNIPNGDAQEKFEKLLSYPVELDIRNRLGNPDCTQ